MSTLKRPGLSAASRPGLTPRGGLGSLNVDLGGGSDGIIRSTQQQPRSGNAGANSNASGSSGFNDELNRLLHADQAALAASSTASASAAAKRPLPGRRAGTLSSNSTSSPAAAPASPSHAGLSALSLRSSSVSGANNTASSAAAASASSGGGSLTSRGPRPRQSTGGAYTSRVTAKEAAASAAAAAATAAAAASGRQVSSDSDSDDGDRPPRFANSRRNTVNTVSSNAAAALYANNNNYNNSSSANNGSAASTSSPMFPAAAPTLSKLSSISLQVSTQSSSAASGYPANSPTSPSNANSSSSFNGAAASSSASNAAPNALYASGSSGSSSSGGVSGEKDPSLKWSAVDSFALSTPKQKTGSVLVLAAHLTRGPATPHVADKARAIFRWICECIIWVPMTAGGAPTAVQRSAARAASPTPPASAASAPRARGVSEASLAAREAAKAAAESKMEAEAKQHAKPGFRGSRAADEDDSDDEDGAAGTRGTGPAIDLLIDVPEILRRRRASAEGLALLFQALADSAGLECATVQGYGKGCGLVKVAERFEAPNHFWNAVKIADSATSATAGQGQWALIDVAWSSGYVNGGRLERQFSNAYFRPNPTIYALQHFPTKCIWPPAPSAVPVSGAGGAAAAAAAAAAASAAASKRLPSKAIAEFLKNPDRLQFLDFGAGSGSSASASAQPKRFISKQQFEDAMMIDRGYLDHSILILHPLGVHTVRHDTPLYSISLQAPSALEFVVGFNMPKQPMSSAAAAAGAAAAAPRFVDQCWNVSYTPMADDPSQSRVDISFVFPWKGTYTSTIRARRLASKLPVYDDIVHHRFQVSCGLFDIRKERDVFVGFLAKRITVGQDSEFEHRFAVTRPLKGHFELNQPVRLQIVAPASVTRMVAVNNGRWIELQSSLGVASANSGNAVSATSASSKDSSSGAGGANFNPMRGKQVFEGDLKLQRYPDIQIHYKTKGQQFNMLFKYGVSNDAGEGSSSSGSGASHSSEDSGSTVALAAAAASESKHGKIVLDSRGTCFEKRLHITALKIGKRSAQILFDTKAGTAVKAEVRSGWNSAIKVNDKITVTQTGSRAAAEGAAAAAKCGCASQPCVHSSAFAGSNAASGGASASNGAPQYDQVSWDVTTQLAEPGDYSLHLFLSSAGSGVFRFALVLYLRIGDKAAGFNLDV